ncbi:MAG: hypothetical protein DMG62_22240 [Acidobacteria bacterium]|nr:MAG: hypothetical protein DMG62_22240 [Acidobacteriota bacterium]
MIHRRYQSRAQQLGQFPGVDLIALVAALQQRVLARIAHQYFTDLGPKQIVKPAGVCTFFKSDAQTAAHSMNETQNRSRVGSEDRLHH